jgi:hypothetical protein
VQVLCSDLTHWMESSGILGVVGGKAGPVWGLAPVGGRGYKERVQEVNMVEILRTHV